MCLANNKNKSLSLWIAFENTSHFFRAQSILLAWFGNISRVPKTNFDRFELRTTSCTLMTVIYFWNLWENSSWRFFVVMLLEIIYKKIANYKNEWHIISSYNRMQWWYIKMGKRPTHVIMQCSKGIRVCHTFCKHWRRVALLLKTVIYVSSLEVYVFLCNMIHKKYWYHLSVWTEV